MIAFRWGSLFQPSKKAKALIIKHLPNIITAYTYIILYIYYTTGWSHNMWGNKMIGRGLRSLSAHLVFTCSRVSGLKIMSSIYQRTAIPSCPVPGDSPDPVMPPCWALLARRPGLFVCLCPKCDTVLRRGRGRHCPWPDLSPPPYA